MLTIDLGELPLLPTRVSLQDQTLHMGITIRKMEDRMINAQSHHSTKTMKIDLETDLSTIRMGTGETMETFLVLHRLKGETIRKIVHTANQKSYQPNNSAFRRSDSQPTTSYTPYEQKFPQNNNQTASNVLRFTTTDENFNELSDLCPLNY